jgi:hypothetical protein
MVLDAPGGVEPERVGLLDLLERLAMGVLLLAPLAGGAPAGPGFGKSIS